MADPALPGLASWAEEYCGGVLVGATLNSLNCPVRGSTVQYCEGSNVAWYGD